MNVPNKFGEYLSAGIPIMLGIDGEMSELTSKYNCGYVYNDGKDLAQYIFKLIENKGLLKIMGDNAIKLYKERFDANKVYSEMAAHLELISQNKIKE
jgi:glycosyltransferase involved in cell wall biosynthesis